MADDGNYRETRYFSCWPRERALEDWPLPPCVAAAANYGKGQSTAPFGYAVVEALGSVFGVETCEELWTPDAPHIDMALAGCEMVGNGSGSHHQLRKLDTRVNLITSASSKAGGECMNMSVQMLVNVYSAIMHTQRHLCISKPVYTFGSQAAQKCYPSYAPSPSLAPPKGVYLYSNQRGCDGGRLYFDGGALVVQNGQVLQQAPQFSVRDVEVSALVHACLCIFVHVCLRRF